MIPTPQTAEAGQPKKAQAPKGAGTAAKYIGFTVIAIILGLGIGLGAHQELGTAGLQAVYSATGHSSTVQASTTVPASTSAASTSIQNTYGCPCLNKQQIETIFNDSAGYEANATLNITQLNSSALLNNLLAETPTYITDNITTGWSTYYTSSLTPIPQGQFKDSSVPTQEKLIGTSAELKDVNYAYLLYNYTKSSLSGKLTANGTQNGFVYAYGIGSQNIGLNANESFIDVIGYKGNNFVYILFASQKNITPQNIIDAISSTI